MTLLLEAMGLGMLTAMTGLLTSGGFSDYARQPCARVAAYTVTFMLATAAELVATVVVIGWAVGQ